jgi:hypothetical protein
MTKFGRFSFIGTNRYLPLVILLLPVALVFNILVVLLLLLNPRSWSFNRSEATAILDKEMTPFRGMNYEDCKKFVEAAPALNTTVVGESGTQYNVQVVMIWDRCLDGPIRVIGSIDDGRLRAYKPVTKSFLVDASAV